MTSYVYHLIDNNTGEEVYPSSGFRFLDVPQPNHRIHDADLMARFGGPAIVDRVEELANGTIRVYIDAVEERLNDDNVDPDQSYRRS